MAEHPRGLRHHFVDLGQQTHAARLGIWVFIISELMLFGGMFTGYALYRTQFHEGFAAGSNHLNIYAGTINTVVLLISSFTVAAALHHGREGQQRQLRLYLGVTLVLGACFLGIKAYEYWHHIETHLVPGTGWVWHGPDSQHAHLFMIFYWYMTATHALHMLAGMSVLGGVLVLSKRGKYSRQYHSQIEAAGLYWHFVDLIWIFLFPLLYLIGRHQ